MQRQYRFCTCVISLGFLTKTLAAQTTWYVDADASGPTHDGTSWCSAFECLNDALAVGANGDTILVADGLYFPDCGPNVPPFGFGLPDGVTILGGHAGCGAGNPNERDPETFSSILSSDLNQDDDDPVIAPTDCCNAHATPGCDDAACQSAVCDVYSFCCDFTQPWDEFCAYLARIECSACPDFFGDNSSGLGAGSLAQGVVLDGFVFRPCSTTAINSRVTFRSCSFERSRVYLSGTEADFISSQFVESHLYAIRSLEASPAATVRLRISDCLFTRHGTAIYSRSSSVIVSRSVFYRNGRKELAGDDGGPAISAVLHSHLHVDNSLFLDNAADSFGGGAAVSGFDLTLRLANSLFVNNRTAENGGALWMGGGSAFINNCTFFGNSAGERGGALATAGGFAAPIALFNSILWNNNDSFGSGEFSQFYHSSSFSNEPPRYTCIQGWTGILGGVGNHGLDPMFIDPDGGDDVIGTLDDNLRLLSGSPCVDAASNALISADETDLDNDGDTGEPIPFDLAENPRQFNDPGTPDTGEGTPPIVDMGAYEVVTDCNGNGRYDGFDILEGTSVDCPPNGVPDECEDLLRDCNQNDIDDLCETDADADGRIDDCDSCPNDPLNDIDGDNLCANFDNCPSDFNPDQADGDNDGIGDACRGPIPTVSSWGLILLTLLLLIGAKLRFSRHVYSQWCS